MADKSDVIASAVTVSGDIEKFNPGQTAAAWFARRIRNQRVKNRTGPETWRASRGTEHVDDTVQVGMKAVGLARL